MQLKKNKAKMTDILQKGRIICPVLYKRANKAKIEMEKEETTRGNNKKSSSAHNRENYVHIPAFVSRFGVNWLCSIAWYLGTTFQLYMDF